MATCRRNGPIQRRELQGSVRAAPHTHRLPGLDVGRPVCQDGFEDRFQGLEHLLAFDARAQLDAQEAGQGSCRPLLFTFAWQKQEWESAFPLPFRRKTINAHGYEVVPEPFLRQRSMLSVMVILLSEMNSYRMRVAIAVLSPSSAPCLVFALRKQTLMSFTPCWVCDQRSQTGF